MTLVLIFLAITLNGGFTSAYIVNALEIAPNFAGTVYGVMNTFASLPGFFGPLVVGAITSEQVNPMKYTNQNYIE